MTHVEQCLALFVPAVKQPEHLFFSRTWAIHISQFMPQGAIRFVSRGCDKFILSDRITSNEGFPFMLDQTPQLAGYVNHHSFTSIPKTLWAFSDEMSGGS